MIDTPTCKSCGKPVEQAPGRRKREFCNPTCRQRHHRASQKPPQHGQAQTHELEEARQRITELEREVMRLEYLLDVEKRFQQDTQSRGFKSWLKKIQIPSSLSQKLLADPLFPPRGSRAYYEAHLHKMKYSTEEIEEFRQLWKHLLLQS